MHIDFYLKNALHEPETSCLKRNSDLNLGFDVPQHDIVTQPVISLRMTELGPRKAEQTQRSAQTLQPTRSSLSDARAAQGTRYQSAPSQIRDF